VFFNPATGQGRFHARNVRVKDFHDINNAIGGGGPKPVASHVSFDVRWHGRGDHRSIRDAKFGFEGHYVTGKVTVAFAARQDGASVIYRSDPAGQYNPTVMQGGAGSPAVGQERNGVFFQ
jgi:hypothetical protein